ncbi:MAG: hypothetical protein LBD23_12755 [Oscillospiraceae bacterium]|jgi:diacylglycerol kinase family enzyme|nr:hypothetical protein [Oscillospiraceae bacterium]
MKHYLIINPHSFRTKESIEKIVVDIENSFSTMRDTSYSIYVSRYSRDAIAAVHRYVSECPEDEIARVYAIGGDGILFDCLNGMVGFPNAELTSVPYGNDNDYIRVFGENVYDRFRDLRALAAAPSRPVDIINCGSNYAMIEAQIGFAGQTVIYASEIFQRIPEKLLRNNVGIAYTLCALKSIFNNEIMRQYYTIYLDDEEVSGNYCHIHIANTACYGGTMVPNPYARPDKGFLDVLFINTTRKRDIIRTIGDYNKGHFEKHEFNIHRQCKKIEIKSERLISVEMDGEGFYAKELKFAIVPGGIKFFAPEDLSIMDYSFKAYKNNPGRVNADERN